MSESLKQELINIAKAIEVGWDTSVWKRPNIPDELRTIADALERDQSAREAAVLRKAAEIADRLDVMRQALVPGEAYSEILKLIPDGGISALDDLLREARLREAEWWYGLAVDGDGVSDDPGLAENKRLAELRASLEPEGK